MYTFIVAPRILILCLAPILVTDLATASLRYRIELIASPPTRDPSQDLQSVVGLNNRGDVVFGYGRSSEHDPSRSVTDSYVANRDGIIAIPNLGSESVQAAGINDAGIVVGGGDSEKYIGRFGENYYFEPFVYRNGQTVAIQTSDRGFTSATAVNNRGEVVGSAWSDSTGSTAFKWSESEGYIDLGNFDAEYVNAADINEQGDVLITVKPGEVLLYGESYYYDSSKTVIYNNGKLTEVPDTAYGLTKGSAINDHGVVVGNFGAIPGVESHAYIWDAENGFVDLGFGGERSYATDVNNDGIVIGAYSVAYGVSGPTPFVYTQQNGRERLIDLVDNLEGLTWIESATHINDRGQIVGIARTSNTFSGRRVYLATPIPEPATGLLMLLASVGVLRLRKC